MAEEWQAGDELSADRLNRMAGDAARGAGVAAGAGVDGFAFSGGTGAAARPPQEFWVRLTGGGTSGRYAWVEQVPDDDGAWSDGERSGTATEDPAVEVGGVATLAAGTRARAWRQPGSRRLNFQAGAC